MALFGSPFPSDNDAASAVQAATDMFQMLAARSDDRPAALLTERCRRFHLAPPADWEGVVDHE